MSIDFDLEAALETLSERLEREPTDKELIDYLEELESKWYDLKEAEMKESRRG